MPTIEVDREELNDLVGREIPKPKLEKFLPNIKCEVEEIKEYEVKVEVTPDRIDLLSVEGIARALRNYLRIKKDDYSVKESDIDMKISKVKARPRIAAGAVKGVYLDERALKSIMKLQEKLHETYGRKRERVAIGLHDLDKIEPPFSYSGVKPEKASFVPLGWEEEVNLKQILMNHKKGKKFSHILEGEDKFPVITDSEGDIISFPPIINSKKSEVTKETRNIFIDVTGTDEESVKNTLKIIAAALADRGGKVYGVNLDFNGEKVTTPNFDPEVKEIKKKDMERIIGTSFDRNSMKENLRKFGYEVSTPGDRFKVEIPFYRSDILGKVDIAEDIAMGIGYNNLELELPDLRTHGEEEKLEKTINNVRDLMMGLSYQEVLNPVLTDEKTLLSNMNRESDIVKLENPVSDNYKALRDLLLPQVMKFLSRNTHVEYPQKIFEVGEAVVRDENEAEKTKCDRKLVGVNAGANSNYTEARGELEGMLSSLDVPGTFEFKKDSKNFFLKGRAAKVIYDGNEIGFIGEVHPECLNNFGIEMPISAFEVNLEFLEEI